MRWGSWLLVVLSSWLVSCASWYDSQVVVPASYKAPLQIDESYNISGRFSIKAGSEDYYGNFVWQHESGLDNLTFMSPLGTTAAEISVDQESANLITGGKHYSGSDLDELLSKRLGFTLPLAYLHYWIQGVPLPQYPLQEHLVSGFSQLGWQVEILSWQDANHPRVVLVTKDRLRIKLLINWPLDAAGI